MVRIATKVDFCEAQEIAWNAYSSGRDSFFTGHNPGTILGNFLMFFRIKDRGFDVWAEGDGG